MIKWEKNKDPEKKKNIGSIMCVSIVSNRKQ